MKSSPLIDHLNEVVNPTWNYAKRCKSHDDEIMNAAVGLAAEAGEVLDVHKKMFYHKPKDRREELVEELGDVCYYLSKVLELHDITLEECLANNRAKLWERYDMDKVTK